MLSRRHFSFGPCVEGILGLAIPTCLEPLPDQVLVAVDRLTTGIVSPHNAATLSSLT